MPRSERIERGCPCRRLKLRQMRTQRVQIKGVLRWLVRWAGTRDFCPALAALVGTVQNIFFLTVHYFNLFVPIAQQPGQAVVLGRLSLCVSGPVSNDTGWRKKINQSQPLWRSNYVFRTNGSSPLVFSRSFFQSSVSRECFEENVMFIK